MPARVELPEDERQAVLLAIAHLAVERPGWLDYLRGIAARLEGVEMFDQFRDLRAQPDRPRT
jgi:hypothetical protein